MSTQKQTYYQRDMEDWCDSAGVDLNFPDVFPIRSVLPLRATLAGQCDPAIIQTLCERERGREEREGGGGREGENRAEGGGILVEK